MKQFSSISFVAGVMSGMLVSGAWFLSANGNLSPADSLFSDSPGQPNKAKADASSLIQVHDQPAGDSVAITSLNAPSGGAWAAVREMHGDSLANVLGAVRISGSHAEVVVPLLRGTEPGRQYAVELYRDDGLGEFDPATYSVYIDFDTGSPAVSYFGTNPL